jgi:trypsin
MSTGFRLSRALPLLLVFAKLGKALAEPRIVGGKDADSGRYSYFTTLYRSEIRTSEFICGGSLIAPDVVLSAAHCIDESVPINYVVVNNTNHGGTNPYGHVRRIIDTIVHPSWDPVTLRNDLMLMILAEPVDVEPIAYSRQFPAITILDTLQILGLGRLEDGGSLPGTLQEAKVSLSDFDDCDDAYSDGDLLSFLTGLSEASQFCAAGPGIDSCQGDSGGPLILSSSSDTATDVQLGLVSFGSGCAEAEFPGK